MREIAIEKELFRRDAREDFRAFIAWTMPDYHFNWHHIHLIRKLEAFQRGEIQRLMVFMPPRHGKSQLVSRHLPAWIFGQNPNAKIIACSYSADLASSMNRDVQKIMLSEEYSDVFPKSSLNKDNVVSRRQARRNSTTFDIGGHEGHYLSAGVGGPITGKGADCFPAGVVIMTNKGLVDIKDIYIRPFAYKVLSLNHGNSKLQFKEIEAVKCRKAFGLHRITTAGGRMVESTASHRFYSRGEYREAATLTTGDSLMCLVSSKQNKTCGGLSKMGKEKLQRSLLRQRVRSKSSCDKKQLRVPKVLRVSEKGQQILQHLRKRGKKRIYRSTQDCEAQSSMPKMRKTISTYKHTSVSFESKPRFRSILLSGMRESSSCEKNEWRGQFELEGRGRALYIGIQEENKISNKEKRWWKVRGLRHNETSGLSSYRRKSKKQRPKKPCDALSDASRYFTQERKESVSVVERICRKEGIEVYDIQVADNHNFFANGILVHNCAIIDDPIKNQEEAESETYREKLWKWYTSTLFTRLEKDACVLLTLTRWHEDDLAGRLLKQMEDPENEFAEDWEVVSFPAIKEKEDNPSDPRRIGEALWPGKYDDKRMQVIESTIGSRYWNALYCQTPVTEGGNIIKEEWFKTYIKDHIDPPTINFYLDSAFTNKSQNDPSAIMAYFEMNDNLYIWHSKTIRMSFVDLVAFLAEYIGSYGSRAGYLKVEPKASGLDIVDYLRKKTNITVIEDEAPKDAKVTRVHAATPYIEGGRVLVPEDESWVDKFMSEMKSFPTGKHDDQVDCLTGAIKDTLRDEGIWMVGYSH